MYNYNLRFVHKFKIRHWYVYNVVHEKDNNLKWYNYTINGIIMLTVINGSHGDTIECHDDTQHGDVD